MKPPLNGSKTHPLSTSTRLDLMWISQGPQPRQKFNPGAANRLERGGLVTIVMLPSPYKTHNGKNIAHLQISPAGKVELANVPVAKR